MLVFHYLVEITMIVGVIELLKVMLQFSIAIVLIIRWLYAKVRFYSDIPFIFGLAMISFASGELLDILMDFALITKDFHMYQLRISILTIGIFLMLYMITLIWMRERIKIRYLILFTYLLVFIGAIFVSQSISQLLFYVSILLVFIMVPGMFTFFLMWRLKRLPQLNSFLIFISGMIIMIGQLLEPFLLSLSFIWIGELIDFFGWSIMLMGLFIKPNYAHEKL